MLDDFMIRMFTPILWREKREERNEEELRPLSFARLRGLFSCSACETCCGQAA
jgi:hypothetical protein